MFYICTVKESKERTIPAKTNRNSIYKTIILDPPFTVILFD